MQGRGEESHDSQWAGFRDPNKFPQRSLLFLTVTSAAQSARPRFRALISELKSSVSCLPRRLQGSLQRCPRDVAAPCGPAGGHQAGRAGPAGHAPPCTAASLGTPRRWLPAAPAGAGRDGTGAMGRAQRDGRDATPPEPLPRYRTEPARPRPLPADRPMAGVGGAATAAWRPGHAPATSLGRAGAARPIPGASGGTSGNGDSGSPAGAGLGLTASPAQPH